MLVVDLGIAGLDGVLVVVGFDLLPQLLDGPGDDTFALVAAVHLPSEKLLLAGHAVGFT